MVKNPPARCGFDPWVKKIPRKGGWQPTLVFLPGEFHGQRSLEGYSSWGHRESNTTEHACICMINIYRQTLEVLWVQFQTTAIK